MHLLAAAHGPQGLHTCWSCAAQAPCQNCHVCKEELNTCIHKGGSGKWWTECDWDSDECAVLLPVVCRCRMLPRKVHHNRLRGTATCTVQAKGLVPQPLQYRHVSLARHVQIQTTIAGRIYLWPLAAWLRRLQRLRLRSTLPRISMPRQCQCDGLGIPRSRSWQPAVPVVLYV